MTRDKPSEKDLALWRTLFESEMAFMGARQKFLAEAESRGIEVIRRVLRLAGPVERSTALRLLMNCLSVEERQQLFEPLLAVASYDQSNVSLVREAILSLPREWTLSKIERAAEPLLERGTDEEYRRLLELYIEIDRALTFRLATRALRSGDPNIVDAGEDAMRWLNEE